MRVTINILCYRSKFFGNGEYYFYTKCFLRLSGFTADCQKITRNLFLVSGKWTSFLFIYSVIQRANNISYMLVPYRKKKMI